MMRGSKDHGVRSVALERARRTKAALRPGDPNPTPPHTLPPFHLGAAPRPVPQLFSASRNETRVLANRRTSWIVED